MDAETRSRRIKEHSSYHKAMKAWRADVHQRLERWRSELKAAQLSALAATSHGSYAAVEAMLRRREEQQSAERQHLVDLEGEVRRAQLDHDAVSVCPHIQYRNVVVPFTL